MAVYQIHASGIWWLSINSRGTIVSQVVYTSPPSAAIIEAFKQECSPASKGVNDLDPESMTVKVVSLGVVDNANVELEKCPRASDIAGGVA